jgi:hypothetical protein
MKLSINTRQGKARHGKENQGKAKQGKESKDSAIQGKATKRKGRHCYVM